MRSRLARCLNQIQLAISPRKPAVVVGSLEMFDRAISFVRDSALLAARSAYLRMGHRRIEPDRFRERQNHSVKNQQPRKTETAETRNRKRAESDEHNNYLGNYHEAQPSSKRPSRRDKPSVDRQPKREHQNHEQLQ